MYKEVWSGLVGDILRRKCKVRNGEGPHAVAVVKDGLVFATLTKLINMQEKSSLFSTVKLQQTVYIVKSLRILCYTMHYCATLRLHRERETMLVNRQMKSEENQRNCTRNMTHSG